MEATQYLLQINRIKLQNYIQCGLIAPDKYLNEDREIDIQSKNPNFLVVTNGYLKELDEYQILIDLILTQEEMTKLHKIDDLYYFDFPLPITRIKKVYVQDKEIIKHIVVQIQNGENGFLPKKLFEVYTKSKRTIFEQKDYVSLKDDMTINKFDDPIRVFDKRMGMFSFMKNSEIYYCDETKYISNYSSHYFSILSKLLKEPRENNSLKEIDILKHNKEFKDLLYSNSQINKEFILKESQKIENSELKEIFLQIIDVTGTRKALKSLLERDVIEYYLIGLVYYFRQKDSNKKDNFKIDIKSLIPYEVAEISLAILGIYLGYTLIRSEEKIEIDDEYFKRIFKEKFNMKFTLENKLDYVTIETIYNFCFKNEAKGYEYEYLSYPNKVKPKKTPQNKNYRIKKVIHFDSEYIKIKKNENKETGSLFEMDKK